MAEIHFVCDTPFPVSAKQPQLMGKTTLLILVSFLLLLRYCSEVYVYWHLFCPPVLAISSRELYYVCFNVLSWEGIEGRDIRDYILNIN